MNKSDQIIKELKVHIEDDSLREIVEDKFWDMWRAAKRESDDRWIKMYKRIESGLKKLPNEIINDMSKSHKWTNTEEEFDSDCIHCKVNRMDWANIPFYCTENNL